ncbi:hypothetical protein PR048_016514 [Dryococelus australis]|uniref:HAT C-terminal dimerisation domain-containing protein n=1 Tax=Dryococelus australis TaxID=614101 RepID=A0ABQ9HJX0_9NEOP|nr:hypothetical protein PR048_016514 [Dryococelus australis]
MFKRWFSMKSSSIFAIDKCSGFEGGNVGSNDITDIVSFDEYLPDPSDFQAGGSDSYTGSISLTQRCIYERPMYIGGSTSEFTNMRNTCGDPNNCRVRYIEKKDWISKDCNLEKKLCFVFSDNAASIIKACQLLKVYHRLCFAHTLNVVVHDALKIQGIDVISIKCKTLVPYFKSSIIAIQKLVGEQENKNKTPLKLLQEVPACWNSTLQMMKRVVENNDCVAVVLSKMLNVPFGLTFEDTYILNDMICILDMFDEATNKVSGDYVTISLIIPILFLEAMKEVVRTRLFMYEECTIPRLTTILDPRMKKEGFRSSKDVKTLLQGDMAIKTVATAAAESANPKKFKEEKQKNLSETVDNIIMLHQYLERNNADDDVDPMLFWKVSGNDFPSLQICAKKFLSTPATSMPSERIFSKTGLAISERRSNIKPKNMDRLLVVSSTTAQLRQESCRNGIQPLKLGTLSLKSAV